MYNLNMAPQIILLRKAFLHSLQLTHCHARTLSQVFSSSIITLYFFIIGELIMTIMPIIMWHTCSYLIISWRTVFLSFIGCEFLLVVNFFFEDCFSTFPLLLSWHMTVFYPPIWGSRCLPEKKWKTVMLKFTIQFVSKINLLVFPFSI